MSSSGIGAPAGNPRSAFGVRELFAATGLMEKFLPFGQVHDLYSRAGEAKGANLFEAVLAEMKVNVRLAEAEGFAAHALSLTIRLGSAER